MSIITDILKEIPLSAVLKERLSQAEARSAALEQENASLKAENAVLHQQAENLHSALQQAHAQIEHLKKPPGLLAACGSAPRMPGRMG